MKIAVISDSVDFTQFLTLGLKRVKAKVYTFRTFNDFIASGKNVELAMVNMNESLLRLIRKYTKLHPARMQEIRYILFQQSAELLSLIISTAIRQGAVGFISARAQQDEVAQAIEKAEAGGQYFSPDLREELVNIFLNESEAPQEHDESMESVITERLCKGMPSKSIARELNLRDYHVQYYKKIILRKWNVRSMKELDIAVKKSSIDTISPVALQRLPQTG